MTPRLEDAAEQLYLQLHNLKTIAAVAASGSATAAGQVLYKSVSTVARAVGEVEAVLGMPLFERGAGGFMPTVYGKLLVARARRMESESALLSGDIARLHGKDNAIAPNALQHLIGNGRKLLLLIHLADTRTVIATAAALGISQSGASMALGRIEEALGVRLFHRNAQGMMPSDAAVKLVLHAKRIRAELRHAVSELSSVAGRPAGTTVIGTLPLARTDILPRAISACLAKYPDILVQTVDAPASVLLSQLRAGDIDAVVSVPREDFEPGGLKVEQLFLDELVVVAGSAHRLVGQRGLGLADIAGAKWILPWRRSVSRSLFNAQFGELGVEPPRPSVETADLSLMRQLLAPGEMLALTSLRYVRLEIEAGLLARLDVRMAPIERRVVLLRREGTELSPAALSLLDEIREAATS